MIDLALKEWKTFWGPANRTIQYILKPTSGKNVSDALNPVTRQSKSFVRLSFEAFPRSQLDGILKWKK